MEYTHGTKDLNYSFNNSKIKRFDDIQKALLKRNEVVFLDLNLSYSDDPKRDFNELNNNILKFPNLKKLTLNGNFKLGIPDNIFKIKSLEFLSLGGFRNIDSQLESLKYLQNLKFLALGACYLNNFPESILAIKNLQGLDLTLNNIDKIPSEIGKLSSLETIDLTNNCFTEFPIELSSCKKLKWIDLLNAEGHKKEQMESLGFCVNQIFEINGLESFESLEGLFIGGALINDVYHSVNKSYLREKYPNIKIK